MTEETKSAPPSAKDIVVQIAAAIKSYADGGADREAETIALAQVSGLRTDGIAKQWRDVKASRPKASLEHKVIKPPASAAVPLIASGAVPIINRRLAPTPTAESALARLGLKLSEATDAVEASVEPKAEPEPVTEVASAQLPAIVESAPAACVDPDASAEIDWRVKSPGSNLQNAKTAIAKLGIRCQFDDFHKKYIVHGHPCMKGGSVSESLDNMALMVRNEISKAFKLDVSKGLVMEALQIKCMERAFDPVKDYLDGLRWDATPRLDRWLVDYCGAEDTEYVRAVGRKVPLAAVRRAREPGCKFDHMMVLEGPQGAGKSTALNILAGGNENFSDAQVIRLRDKEQQEAIGGIWIYEIAELAGKFIDVEGLKAFLSKRVDSARAAYGHGRTDQRRRCVFIATTNNSQYLKDDTGTRRFWPVKVGQIDLAALRRDRDQLWAEAAAAEATGEGLVIAETLWGVAEEETSNRMELDPWKDIIEGNLATLVDVLLLGGDLGTRLFIRGETADGPRWQVASEYLLTSVLNIPQGMQKNWQTKRVAAIMKSLGWRWHENPIRFGSAGQKRGYTKPVSGPQAPKKP